MTALVFPVLELNVISNTVPCAHSVIFLDELARACEGVQNTLLTLVQERAIENYIIGDKWAIIGATNRKEDDPNQEDLLNAVANRGI